MTPRLLLSGSSSKTTRSARQWSLRGSLRGSLRAAQRLIPLLAVSTLLLAGCAPRVYPPPPPPPPYNGNQLLIEADRRGFRNGADDGARDLAQGTGYHPRADRKYADTPGYDPALGPFPPYRDTFRRAYLRGYYNGFYHR